MSSRRTAGLRPPWPHVILLDPFNPGLAIARRMRRLGARVTVLEPEPRVAHSRGVHGVTAPYEPTGESWREALERISSASGECVLLVGTDRASEWLLAETPRLPANVRAFERSGGAHLSLMDKNKANLIASEAGVRVPWSARIASEADLHRVEGRAPWPCVVKPALSHQWRERYGELRAFFVADVDEARGLLGAPLADGVEMLLSQYIPGGDEDVEEAIIVRLADGSYPVKFGCRKLRQDPAGFGATALGESSQLPETMALAQRILDHAGFVGVAGVEAKRHADTGERWFLEVNVRLPAQWGLGDACGVEATPRLISSLAGLPLGPQAPLRPGVRFVRFELDWHRVAEQLRAAPLAKRPEVALRSIRPYFGAGELGVLDLRDPGPILALAKVFLARRVTRVAGRLFAAKAAPGAE